MWKCKLSEVRRAISCTGAVDLDQGASWASMFCAMTRHMTTKQFTRWVKRQISQNQKGETMRRIFFVIVGLLLPLAASAQDPATSFTARYYTVGGTTPVQSETFAAAALSCNQALPTTPDSTNPTRLFFKDNSNSSSTVTLYCIYTTPTTSPLRTLPAGNYEGSLLATNAGGSSPESTRIAFSRIVVVVTPVSPTAVRILR